MKKKKRKRVPDSVSVDNIEYEGGAGSGKSGAAGDEVEEEEEIKIVTGSGRISSSGVPKCSSAYIHSLDFECQLLYRAINFSYSPVSFRFFATTGF